MRHLTAFIMCVGLVSGLTSHASFLAEVDYSQLHRSDNRYQDSAGNTFTSGFNTDFRFLGLGLRYRVDQMFGGLSSELFAKGLFGANLSARDGENELSMYEFGSSFGYQFGNHEPFVSLMAVWVDLSSELKYSRGEGYQLGYRYHIDERHSLYTTHSWRVLRSANPEGNVFNQRTVIQMVAVGYSFRFI